MSSIYWLLLFLGPLLILQNRLHLELQAIFFLLTHRIDISMIMFSIIFLPGVILHEISHIVMARILGVRTGKLSIIPQPTQEGRLRLGYVETAKTDMIRDALIGVAPLISGSIFVSFVGLTQLNLTVLWDGWESIRSIDWQAPLKTIVEQDDFWLWFYLLFAISSTMMPSRSDRRAWLPVLLLFLIIFGSVLFAGAGPWLLENLYPLLDKLVFSLVFVFGISLFIHVLLLIPLFFLRKLLSRFIGYDFT